MAKIKQKDNKIRRGEKMIEYIGIGLLLFMAYLIHKMISVLVKRLELINKAIENQGENKEAR